MDSEVLIAGAGPTGLTLACDLLRRGVSCRIIDQAAGPSEGSRGFTLKPRSLAVLAGLGSFEAPDSAGEEGSRRPAGETVADRIRRAGRLEAQLRVHLGAEKLLDLTVPPDPDPARNSVALPQYRTEEILRDRLHELGGEVAYGTGLAGFTDTGDEVKATLTDGTVHSARFLVGADGGRSTVRTALGIGFEGRTNEDMRALISDVPIEGLNRADGVHLWMLPNGMVAARPIPHDTHWQLVIGGGPAAREAAFKGREIKVGEPRWQSEWRYNARLATAYRRGNVFLCGDAAHVHSPFGGHGMNTGIQDAANLGWKLQLVTQGAASRRLLDTYETERLPVGRAILADSDKQKSALLPPRPLRPLLRFVVARTLRRVQIRTRDDHPRYPEGPLIGKGGGDVAGHEGRVFTLLTAGTAPATEGLETRVVRTDKLKRGTIALVRPDGYVGTVARNSAELTAYVTSLTE
jgi:2-polyprenyl-6-methoxyphenol hydroxylase-like FAD-dependent oxidoreductase